MIRLRELLGGTRDHLGWWTLPVFLAVGLAGAVLAGGLAVIYYSGQVNALREETRSARDEASRARDEIREATDEALGTINEQVEAVRQSLTTELPVEDAFDAGVVVVRAFPGPPPAPPSPPPSPAASPAPSPQASPEGQANSANQEDPPPAEEEQPQQPEPPPDRGAPRFGSAFPVVRDAGAVFYVTAFEVVESPYQRGQFVSDIEIITAGDTVRAQVHSFDAGLDLALLRVGGEVDVPEWRPLDEELLAGDKLWAVGLTPTLNTAQIGGTIAAIDPRVIVTDIAIPDYLRGGPIVDLDGRVVGIATAAYRPYGGDESQGHAAVPIRALCERLLRCTDEQQGGTGGSPSEPPPEG